MSQGVQRFGLVLLGGFTVPNLGLAPTFADEFTLFIELAHAELGISLARRSGLAIPVKGLPHGQKICVIPIIGFSKRILCAGSPLLRCTPIPIARTLPIF